MTTTRRSCSTGCRTHRSTGIDLLYPDPWPKKKHWKRRFVSPVNLDRFSRVLKVGRDFPLRVRHRQLRQLDAARLRARMAASRGRRRIPSDWKTPYPGWPGTRYEAKALREGRTPAYLSFLRTAG